MDWGERMPREVSRFYSRVRSQIKDMHFTQEQDPHEELPPEANAGKWATPYAVIPHTKFEELINAYDSSLNQKHSGPIVDSHKNSYSDILASSQGFIHQEASSYLAKLMSIRDAKRNCLLGGLSYFEPRAKETLEGIRESHFKMWISDAIEAAHKYMDAKQMELAFAEINKVYKERPKDSSCLAAKARFHAERNDGEAAEKNFKLALENERGDKTHVKKLFAKYLYKRAMDLYQKADYKDAYNLFKEAERYDRSCEGLTLHMNLCSQKIGHGRINPYTQRRK